MVLPVLLICVCTNRPEWTASPLFGYEQVSQKTLTVFFIFINTDYGVWFILRNTSVGFLLC